MGQIVKFVLKTLVNNANQGIICMKIKVVFPSVMRYMANIILLITKYLIVKVISYELNQNW